MPLLARLSSLSRLPRRVATASVLLLVVLLGVALGGPPAGADTVPVGAWPLRPTPAVARRFDPPDARWGSGHRGVDLLGRAGQPVRAALPGTVSFAGVIAGRGVVVVDHGDTRTTYEPVAASVARGEPVRAGAVLGRLAPGGSHCPPQACLHWGWLRGTTYLDPLLLVGAGPVRLLPLGSGGPAYAGWRPSLPAYAGLGFGALTPAGAPAGRPGAGGPW